MQLQGQVKQFEQAGINVVVLTYDSPALQQKFIDKFAITYPVLSDVEATSVKNLGILNADYKPGDSNFGLPYPGVYIVDTNQRVAGKIFIEGYVTRVDASGVLEYALKSLPER